MNAPNFGDIVLATAADHNLVVQPRMGVSRPDVMRRELLATRTARAHTVGTITLDSYTRVGDHESARAALASGVDLNGYPIVDHSDAVTRRVLDGVCTPDFQMEYCSSSLTTTILMSAPVVPSVLSGMCWPPRSRFEP